MSVSDAVERDLEAIAERDRALADSTMAAVARSLASELDSSSNSATSKSMCARELREVMAHLRDLTPEKAESDPIDDLSARRTARRGLPAA